MTRLTILVSLLAGAVLLGLRLHDDPGMVIISTHTWHIETPLWVAVVSCIVTLFLLHILSIIVHFIYTSPASLQSWYHRHKQYQAQNKTRQALIEFSEGYWQSAQKHLIEALPNTDIPLFNYLTAARAAQELGQTQWRDHYLRLAQHMEPKANIAVKLTQAQLQISSQQWEQALATLQHLHELTPKHPYVLKLLAQLYETVKDWEALLRLLPSLKKYSTLSTTQLDILQHRLYLAWFQEQCHHAQQADSLKASFKTLPRAYQAELPFLIPYLQTLYTFKDWQTVNQLIKQALTHSLNDPLLSLYTDLPIEEDKLSFIKTLLKRYPHAANAHYCLGRLNLQARLFGQAKFHFEESLSIHAEPCVYYYLGLTLEKLELYQEATVRYKKGLQSVLQTTHADDSEDSE